MKEINEIYPGVFEKTLPDNTKIICGEGWSSHIHIIPEIKNHIKIENPVAKEKEGPNTFDFFNNNPFLK